jgi:hypothetical protein
MPTLVWKPWALSMCKTFVWLIIQNWMWTADRLDKRGWQNCGLCKLCNQVQDAADHLLFKCRYTIHFWTSLKDWLGLYDIDPTRWQAMATVKEWWMEGVHKRGHSMKAMASLAMLVSWEVSKERNARFLGINPRPTLCLFPKLKRKR